MVGILCSLFFVSLFSVPTASAVTGWTTDHNNCDTSYLSIDCSAGQRICAYNGTLTCGVPATINALLPSSAGTADNKDYEGTGGYLMNCTNSAASCASPWECKASSTCANKNLKTTCTASAHTSSCGTCLTGYLDCNGAGTGVDADGCEIQIGSTCTSGSLTGTYESTCQGSLPPVCNTENVTFRTAEQATSSSSNPLLWGTQYGAGDLLNLSKSGGNSVVIDNDGNVGIGTTSPGALLEAKTSTAGAATIVKGTADDAGLVFTLEKDDSDNGIFRVYDGDGNEDIRLSTDDSTSLNYFNLKKFVIGGTSNQVAVQTGYTIFEVQGNSANIGLQNTGAATNEKEWLIEADSAGALVFQTKPDGMGAIQNWLKVDRTGSTVDSVSLPNGNIGIGTTAPGQKLNVIGNIKLGDSSNPRGLNFLQYYLSLGETENNASTILGNNIKVTDGVNNTVEVSSSATDGSNFIKLNYTNGISFHRIAPVAIGTQYNETTGELMRITTAGNVGIGITSPTEKLDVSGNIAATGTICDGVGNCLDTLQDTGQWTLATNDIYYSSGNVGIGTTSPQAQLDVEGWAYFGEAGSTVSVGFDAVGGEKGLVDIDNTKIIAGHDSWGYRYGGYGENEGITIDASGNVGIGTSLPAAKLEVAGTAKFGGGTQGYMYLSDASVTGELGLINDLDESIAVKYEDGTFRYGGHIGLEPLIISATGNVGIGTITPSTTLDVVGGLKVGTQSTFGVGTTQSCTTSLKGTVQYNPDQNAMNYCNGSAWVQFGVSGCPTAVRDNNGNWYDTVQIGNQCWTAENINVGTKIDDPGSSAITTACAGNTGTMQTIGGIECYCISETYASCQRSGSGGTTQKYCYDNTESNCTANGALYEWQEAMDLPANCAYTDCSAQINTPHQGICPDGWHIPTDTEWKTLEGQLGMSTANQDVTDWRGTNEGDKLKTIDKCYGGVNCASSGFSAPLAGYRSVTGGFNYSGSYAYVWASSQYSSTHAWRRGLHSGYSTVRNASSKYGGFSLRCLKD